jgi:hypothetical protein
MRARWTVALTLAGGIAIAAWARAGDPALDLAPGAAEAAIARGLAYLRADPSDLSARIVLDYLQRKYALPADLAFDAARTDEDDRKLHVWGRFVGADAHPEPVALGAFSDDGAVPVIETIVMHALYCDRFVLPPAYGELIARLAVGGDYELTHAVLAMKLAGDRGCAVSVAGAARPAELARRTRALALRPTGDPRFEPLDIRYEALAVLEDFLADHSVPSTAIARLVAEQQPDGGWRPSADQSSAPHPTVMAVWALLAWTRPGNSEVAFARP